MTYRGRIQDGVVVLEPGSEIPDGTEVTVEVELQGHEAGSPVRSLLDLPNLAIDTGVDDLATNVDHYLYGHPRT